MIKIVGLIIILIIRPTMNVWIVVDASESEDVKVPSYDGTFLNELQRDFHFGFARAINDRKKKGNKEGRKKCQIGITQLEKML